MSPLGKRALTLSGDASLPESREIMEYSIRILGLLTEAIRLAGESNKLIRRSFGPGFGRRKTDAEDLTASQRSEPIDSVEFAGTA